MYSRIKTLRRLDKETRRLFGQSIGLTDLNRACRHVEDQLGAQVENERVYELAMTSLLLCAGSGAQVPANN